MIRWLKQLLVKRPVKLCDELELFYPRIAISLNRMLPLFHAQKGIVNIELENTERTISIRVFGRAFSRLVTILTADECRDWTKNPNSIYQLISNRIYAASEALQ